MNTHRINIDLRGYWHPGGGRGQGMVLDATCHRDACGLPVRHLKGLLRDALERAEAWGWSGYGGLAATLFGERTEEANGGLPQPSCLRVGDGGLPASMAAHLASDAGKDLIPGVFRSLYATAVEQDTSAARDKSLRGIEVVVPLQIAAQVGPIPGREPPPDWPELLRAVLPLIEAVGAHRSRGLGRAVLTLEVAP